MRFETQHFSALLTTFHHSRPGSGCRLRYSVSGKPSNESCLLAVTILTVKLVLKTNVQQSPPEVWAGFNQSLFEKLAPPFPRIRLLRYDGSTAGCTVEVELNFMFFRQIWQSDITEQSETKDEIWFIDQGSRLPFFLKFWRHRHRLLRIESGTQIVDDIEYRTGSSVMDYLMFPLMWAQFAYLRPGEAAPGSDLGFGIQFDFLF